MIDILFLLAAVCPAAAAAGREMKGKGFGWEEALVRFAEWFYGITVIDFLVLYLRGAGGFDFSYLTVQFTLKYLLCSLAAAGVLAGLRLAVGRIRKRGG